MNRRILVPSIAAAVLSMRSAARAADKNSAPGAAAMVGAYQLEGVREVGADLLLQADGRFAYAMAYGGADANAAGKWSVDGHTVTLVSDLTPPAGFTLIALQPALLGGYGKEPGKPTLLMVKVSTPRLDMTWSNMEIVAEFSNGQRRAGKTGDNGMLGFLELSDPVWKNALIKRVSVSYPKAKAGPTWFAIDPKSTRSVEVNFEPGPMAPPAFARAVFVFEDDKATKVLLLRSSDGLTPGQGRFVKR